MPVPSLDPPLRLRLLCITCQRISSICSPVLSEGLSRCGGCPARVEPKAVEKIFMGKS